jgi:hypothetical protein
MAGHARLVHADLLDQLADRALAIAHGVEDPPPGRFGDHVEHGKRVGHPLNIPRSIYMFKRMFTGSSPSHRRRTRPARPSTLWSNHETLE